MRGIRKFWVVAAATLLLASAASGQPEREGAGTRASVQVQLDGFAKTAEVVRADGGEVYFELRGEDGRRLRLTLDEFAERLDDETATRPWWARVLNVSSARSLAWVALGFVGQLLFTGRMMVQWVMSERRRQSVVPTMFWWLSLAGATLLVAYFGWRRDLVGVMGQAFGWDGEQAGDAVGRALSPTRVGLGREDGGQCEGLRSLAGWERLVAGEEPELFLDGLRVSRPGAPRDRLLRRHEQARSDQRRLETVLA